MPVGNQRWTVQPRRFVISVILVVAGTFVLCGGVGMTDLNIGAIGFAVIAAGVGLYVVTAVTSRQFAYVAGTAHVLSASLPPTSARQGRCNMQLVVTAPNVDHRSVKVRDPRVPVAKWPEPGTDLPVMVAVSDPRRVVVQWDEVPAHGTMPGTGRPLAGDETAELPRQSAAVRDADDIFGTEMLDDEIRDDEIRDDEVNVPQTDADEAGADDTDGVEADGVEADGIGADGVGVDADEVEDIEDVDVTEVEGRRSIEIYLPGVRITPAVTPPVSTRKPSPRPRISPEDSPPQEPAPGAVPEALTKELRFSEVSLMQADTDDADVPLFDQDAGGGSSAAGQVGWVRAAAVTLFVRDLSASIIFYRDLLRFTEVDAGRDTAMLASGDARIVLRQVDMPPVDRRTVQVMLTVPDVQEAYRYLRDADVPFIHRPRRIRQYERTATWAAQFRDPDGHSILIVENRPVQ